MRLTTRRLVKPSMPLLRAPKRGSCAISPVAMNTEPTKPKIVKGHCPSCGPNRNATVLHEHVEKWENEEAGIWGRETSRMLQCPACNSVYFQTIADDSENHGPDGGERITYSPAPSKRDEPEWMFEVPAR